MSVSQNLDRIIFNHEEAGDYTLSEETANQEIQYLWSLKPKERGLLLTLALIFCEEFLFFHNE